MVNIMVVEDEKPISNLIEMQGLDIDDSMMDKTAAIIYSMTKEERANPKIINASRKRRIAAGAGVPIAEVNRLCKQVQNQKQMMKQMSGMFGGKGGKRGGFKLPFQALVIENNN